MNPEEKALYERELERFGNMQMKESFADLSVRLLRIESRVSESATKADITGLTALIKEAMGTSVSNQTGSAQAEHKDSVESPVRVSNAGASTSKR